ncbi:MAG: zinc transporter ZupT [Candidatus Micrarchaeia archaeon]|jgi:ZIP family zinc transporter
MQPGDIWFPFLLAFLAGMSTAIGGLLVLAMRRFDPRLLAFGLGLSAGVMIYVSFAELLAAAVLQAGFLAANAAFFGGMLFIMAVDFFIPHNYIAEHVCSGMPGGQGKGRQGNAFQEHCKMRGFGARRGKGRGMQRGRRMAIAGAFTAVGIAIHNLPEGLSVFLGGVADPALGITLAFAIAMHNIPEGIAIAMPIYYSTKSRAKAFLYTLAAGLAEPLGALIGMLFLLPFLSPGFLSISLAFVGGIMVFISFDELLPLCFDNRGSGHASILGIIIGMMLMAASLHLL